ncbi:MAG: sulfite exporter TauE/SafE family protein [Burkholderiales bacterium]
MFYALIVIAGAVGFFIGAVGIGGILLIPALNLLAGLSIHEASATALFTFFFTGLVGTYAFHRHGSISWKIAAPVCAGAAAFSFLGAKVNWMVDAWLLNLIVALLVVFAGAYIFAPKRLLGSERDGRSLPQQFLLLGVGAMSGFGSGLSGAGGPLFSVPIMVMLGFFPLIAIGTSQVIQIIAAASGSLGHLMYGSIDFSIALWITGFELAGVLIGVRVAHVVRTERLRAMIAGLCITVGGAMLVKTVLFDAG